MTSARHVIQRISNPHAFLCPITQGVFEDPVIWVDGHTYSRAAISQWLTQHHTSPTGGG